MERRLKFYGWGHEGEGLSDDERSRVARFVTEKLGAEPRAFGSAAASLRRSRCARRASRPRLPSRAC